VKSLGHHGHLERLDVVEGCVSAGVPFVGMMLTASFGYVESICCWGRDGVFDSAVLLSVEVSSEVSSESCGECCAG
jgi:hypothetical protein